MGLFNFLFKDTIFTFKPDFTKSEYDNWLEYIGRGGTNDEWKLLKKRNRWKFPKSDVDRFVEYQNEKMREINKKYGETTPTNIPALKRLAMLYERQGNYEKSIEICKMACSLGMDERSRMLRMIKKAQREPNEEEKSLLDSLM